MQACNCKETVEHMLTGCRTFNVEIERLKDRVVDMGREWSIKALLESGDKQLLVQKTG